MKIKTEKNFEYNGLGFPIIIERVDMVKINSEWHPKIDVKYIANKVIKILASQKERLSGNQLKFIRTYLSMSLRKFASEVVHESHTAVSKWESFGDAVTNMDANIEAMLRLYLIEQINKNTKNEKIIFFEKYLGIKKNIFKSEKNTSTVFLKIADKTQNRTSIGN